LSSTDFRAILHDSIGYYFPTSQSITISLKKQSGNWHEIADPYSAEKVSGNVFNLWINHGINSTAAPTYEYVVLPSITQSGLKAFVKNPTFKILANNKNIQAVRSTTNDLFQFVFHKQGKIQTFSPTDFVDAKTLGLIQLRVNTDKSITLTVAEPTQSKKVFRLSLNGKYTADFAKYDPLTGMTEIRIHLPQGSEAGKCKTIQLKKSL
jgi:chondroitin AC lyase